MSLLKPDYGGPPFTSSGFPTPHPFAKSLLTVASSRALTSVEQAELRAARRRIAELETELAVTKRANELLKAQVVSPKDGSKRSRR